MYPWVYITPVMLIKEKKKKKSMPHNSEAVFSCLLV